MAQSSPPDDALLADLDAQCEDFQAVYREGLRQRDCLRLDDLSGANDACQCMRRLMTRIQVRAARLPTDLAAADRQRPEVAHRTATLRRIIQSVEEVRAQSERATLDLLESTQRQLRQFDTGRRAAKGYRGAVLPRARFVDGSR